MKQIVFFWFSIFFCWISTSGQIVIEGSCDSATSKSFLNKISLYRPIEGAPQPWYSNKNDDLKPDKERRFHIVIDARDTGLFFLGLPNGQQFKFFAFNGDTVHFKLSADKDNSAKILYSGKNGFSNNYINEIRKSVLPAIRSLHSSTLEPSQFWKKIDSLFSTYQKQILRNSTDTFRNSLLLSNTESELLYNIKNIYSSFPDIRNSAYRRFNPVQLKYFGVSSVAAINITDLAYAVNNNQSVLFTESFAKVDTNWSQINEGYIVPSTLPEPFRQAQLGTYILLDAVRLNSSYAGRAMKLFAHQYPHSSYNNIFLQIALSNETNNDNSLEKRKAKMDEASTGIFIINDDSSLEHILNKYAFNKNVLIDCWATWCTYCIVEFSFYPGYDDFFQKNNIVKLFISFDDVNSRNVWQNMLQAKKLTGVHVLINPSMKRKLMSMINFPKDKILPLPRYILLNKEHKVIDANLIRPSNLNFKDYIQGKLKNPVTK